MLVQTFSTHLLPEEAEKAVSLKWKTRKPVENQIKINRNLFPYISKISATQLHRWTQNSLDDCFI